ncbi:hypothetical protein D8674_017989 [Pyrus ussuriensis x Pyrus communis]|uniref:Uncharacterized protein n=1 Tax=Pyrus ussuriensis x Pyrus communis TaxID=2448454 RepID=A0A5N5HE98_9ROSA|nr:hypothetical protein D8674_017989 [Pyrus ussuriensis x Pyrus communis]
MRGHVVSLALQFLGLLYSELDEIYALDEQIAGDALITSFLRVSFPQIFLWELIRGLKISHNICKAVKSHFVIDSSSYMLEKLLNLDFPSFTGKSLALLASPILFLGKNSEEMLMYISFLMLKYIYPIYLSPDNLRPSHYISNITQAGCISKAHMTYWTKCFKAIAKLHEDKQSRLHYYIFSHPRLVLDNVTFGLKRRCLSTAGDNNVPSDSSQGIKKSKASCGKVKHFRPKLVKDDIPNSRKFVTFNIPSEPKCKNVSTKSRMACRTRSSRAFASFSAPKHARYLDTSRSSEGDWSIDSAADDNKSIKDLEATKSSNSSVSSELGNKIVTTATITFPSEKQASIEEWEPWHEAFGAFKNEFKNGVRMLNSIENLIPQGKTFIFRVEFKGVMVRLGLLDVLDTFFEMVGEADGNLRHLVLLLDMERVPCSDDLAALGMPINSLVERLKKLHKGILGKFAKVREIEHAFELKCKEFEHKKSKLK